MHIHSAPSLFPRLVDHVEAAEGAKSFGLKAVVLKEHHGYFSDRINGTIEEQKELAQMGVLIEHLAIFMFPMWPTKAGIDGVVAMIKAVGPEKTVLATDLGQVHNPPPWEGLRIFVQVLLEKGIPKEHLKRMIQDNPSYLLNI